MIDGTIVEGRLTGDPVVDGTGDKLRATFTVAVPRDYKPAGAKYPDSDFYFTVARRKKAENISKFFKKGDVIRVHLRYTQYTKDGERRHLFELIDFKFPLGGNRKRNDDNESIPDEERTYASPDLTDDDLPF